MTGRARIIFFLPLMLLCCRGGAIPKAQDDGELWEATLELLPDLNIPRSGHAVLDLGGELTVIGGHTTGFVPTATAEYFKGGQWHTVESLYPHDCGIVTPLPDGRVLVAGGMDEPFGIGRSLGAELYDPATHSFSPLPILDRKRARGSAAVLSDGTIVISGNWYGEDGIASFSPEKGGICIKETAVPRANPYIIPCAPDNALILSPIDASGAHAGTIVIDRFRGEPFCDSLLTEWHPAVFEANYPPDCFFIGDAALGGYSSLFSAFRQADGQAGVIKQTAERFSLLETASPIPMKGADGESIGWGLLHADKATGRAYITGYEGSSGTIYICRIGYEEGLRGDKAPVTLFGAAGPVRGHFDWYYTLLEGGRIAFAGGNAIDNFNPVGTAFILHTESSPKAASVPLWPLLPAGALVLALLLLILLRKRNSGAPSAPEYREPVPSTGADLASRIATLVEEKQLYLRKGVKVQDIATELGTNVTYISACINGQWGMSFPEYLSGLRIRYAKELMLARPDMPLHQVADEAGFSSEQSFYRSFKAVTGQTPSEWMESEP